MYNYLVKFFRNVTMSFFTAIFVIALAGVTCRDGIMKVSSFYVCRWFPVDDHAAWIGFVVCFLLSFSAATLLSVYATRRKDREYQKLLEAYKAKKEERKK